MTDDEKIVEALSSLGSMSSEMLAIYLEMDVASVRAILPIFDGDLWFQQSDDLWHVMDEEGRKLYDERERAKVLLQKSPIYFSALRKLRKLVHWAQISSVPMERWTINGVSKWVARYEAALDLCKDFETDVFERYIDGDIIDELAKLLFLAEQYTKNLPQHLVSQYTNNRIRKSEAYSVRRRKPIHIAEAIEKETPINIFRRQLSGAQLQMDDLPLIKHYASEEKAHYHLEDLFCERMARIPELLSEEELEYFTAYQQGDMSARDAIIESVMPSAIGLVLGYYQNNKEDYEASAWVHDAYNPDDNPDIRRVSYDDLVQYAALIVCESFDDYYPNPITQFKQFALSNISKRLGDFITQEECMLSDRKPSSYDLYCGHMSLRDPHDYISLGSLRHTSNSSNDIDYLAVYGMTEQEYKTWFAYIKKRAFTIAYKIAHKIDSDASTPEVDKPTESHPESIESKQQDRIRLRLSIRQQRRLTNLYKYGRDIPYIAKAINASEVIVRYYIDNLHLKSKYGPIGKSSVVQKNEPHKHNESVLKPFNELPTKPSIELWSEAFNYTSSSYKYLWALALIDYFFRYNSEFVEANILVEKMIAIAWRGILVQNLSFGKTDQMEYVVDDIKLFCQLSNDATDAEVLDALSNARKRPMYKICLDPLLQNVPFRFLSPWIPYKSNRQIIEQSAKFKKCCMYAVQNTPMGMIIRINPLWRNYIRSNKVEMMNFVRASFLAYLQKRNPNQIVQFK